MRHDMIFNKHINAWLIAYRTGYQDRSITDLAIARSVISCLVLITGPICNKPCINRYLMTRDGLTSRTLFTCTLLPTSPAVHILFGVFQDINSIINLHVEKKMLFPRNHGVSPIAYYVMVVTPLCDEGHCATQSPVTVHRLYQL